MPEIIRSGRLDRYPQVILLQGLSRRTGSVTVYLDKLPKSDCFDQIQYNTNFGTPNTPKHVFQEDQQEKGHTS
jgi:hypothetical protein